MPGPPIRRLAGGTLAVAVVVLAAGCGSGSHSSTSGTSAAKAQQASAHAKGGPRAARSPAPPATAGPGTLEPLVLPDPAPTGVAASPAAVAVIRDWSDALRRGDVRAAASYFAIPSELLNGPDVNGQVDVIGIRNQAQAIAANAGLPCGATLRASDQRGRYVNALFSLSSRPGLGGDCAGASGTARVNFIIGAGHIVRWLRAPDDPGDATGGSPGNGGTPAPGGSPSAPTV